MNYGAPLLLHLVEPQHRPGRDVLALRPKTSINLGALPRSEKNQQQHPLCPERRSGRSGTKVGRRADWRWWISRMYRNYVSMITKALFYSERAPVQSTAPDLGWKRSDCFKIRYISDVIFRSACASSDSIFLSRSWREWGVLAPSLSPDL